MKSEVKEARVEVQTNPNMSQHRYRQNKVKREHSIIEGLLPLLERIASTPGVQSVTPGRISPRSRPGSPGIRFQYRTESGIKLLARSNVAVQEVFVVTDEPDQVVERLRSAGILEAKRAAPGRAGADAGGKVEEGNDARDSKAPPDRRSAPAAKGARRRRPGRRRAGAARPHGEEAAPPFTARSPWSEILERHEQLLELEKRLEERLLKLGIEEPRRDG